MSGMGWAGQAWAHVYLGSPQQSWAAVTFGREGWSVSIAWGCGTTPLPKHTLQAVVQATGSQQEPAA